MSTIYISQNGAVVNKSGGKIIVKTVEQEAYEYPSKFVNNIVVMGNVQITHAVIMDILERKGNITYLDKTGGIKGYLGNTIKFGENIIKQVLAYTDLTKRVEIVKFILQCKLTEQKNMLIRHNKYLKSETVNKRIIKIKHFIKLIHQQTTVEKLLGIEGITAKAYYDCFDEILRGSEFCWSGRNRRPPRDPVNAMLSFAYCLLERDIKMGIQEKGLHSCIGYLHATDNYRESLVYDVMEAFRTSVAERFVFKYINLKKVKENDFVYEQDKCLFSEAARKDFVCQYEYFCKEEESYKKITEIVNKLKKLILQ